MELQYPGVTSQIVELGAFLDTEELKKYKTEIIELNIAYKAMYKKAYRLIESYSALIRDMYSPLIKESAFEKIGKRAKGIISREFGKYKAANSGNIRTMFLSALTCKGQICRYDTACSLAERIYVLDNDIGLSHYMLLPILEVAVKCGYDVIKCPHPMKPQQIEQLIIPELSLAFVSQTSEMNFAYPKYKHIRLDALADKDAYDLLRPQLKAYKRLSKLLLSEAQNALAEAKQLHDKLEAIYNPHVDFNGIYSLAKMHINRLMPIK